MPADVEEVPHLALAVSAAAVAVAWWFTRPKRPSSSTDLPSAPGRAEVRPTVLLDFSAPGLATPRNGAL